MQITNTQNAIIHAQLSSTGTMANKANIIGGITKGRSCSIKDITPHEATELIRYLKTLPPIKPVQPPGGQQANTMRRKIIAMAYQLGWRIDNGKIDMKRLNDWCIKYSYLKQPLNKYTAAELPKVVTVFETMYTQAIKKL
jgi:hypothetical protein